MNYNRDTEIPELVMSTRLHKCGTKFKIMIGRVGSQGSDLIDQRWGNSNEELHFLLLFLLGLFRPLFVCLRERDELGFTRHVCFAAGNTLLNTLCRKRWRATSAPTSTSQRRRPQSNISRPQTKKEGGNSEKKMMMKKTKMKDTSRNFMPFPDFEAFPGSARSSD